MGVGRGVLVAVGLGVVVGSTGVFVGMAGTAVGVRVEVLVGGTGVVVGPTGVVVGVGVFVAVGEEDRPPLPLKATSWMAQAEPVWVPVKLYDPALVTLLSSSMLP